MRTRSLFLLIFACLPLAISGCTQVSRGIGDVTANKYADPRSGTNWVIAPPQLDPPRPSEKTIYISVRNLSDARNVNLREELLAGARKQGWKITNDPEKAHYRLRGDLRFFGEVKPGSGGRGAARNMGLVAGAATGTAAYAAADIAMDNTGAAITGGIAGGLAAQGVANASKPREWAMIIDFVLEVRQDEPVEFTVTRGTSSSASDTAGVSNSRSASGGAQNRDNTQSAEATRTSNYFPHGVRLSAWANQMNMKRKEALPHIRKRMAQVMGSMLPR